MSPEVKNLLDEIELALDWGDSGLWQTRDFEKLSESILDKTGISLSISTLRRIWGKVEYNHLPSAATLDALASFAGYEDWRGFTKSYQKSPPAVLPLTVANEPKPPVFTSRRILVGGAIIIVVAVLVMSRIYFVKRRARITTQHFALSSKLVSRSLPNSVIFNYDLSESPIDSVFFQQSWNPDTKNSVDKHHHQLTSVYYEPGFYKAKLLVGDKIVQEHALLIPTEGWLGIIETSPVPVYLKGSDFINKNELSLPVENIVKNNIPLQPKPPIIKYFNVGNFKPISVHDFSFASEIRNSYRDGAAACQMTRIFLITDNDPIMIPLSIKGCTSELSIMCLDKNISGKKEDLSKFGVDFDQWAKVVCKSAGSFIEFYVNGQLAFKCQVAPKNVNIVGLQFNFQGTGMVKNISLTSGSSPVYADFLEKITNSK